MFDSKINTSQDPEYFGPTGHEKKLHKTHFESPGLRKTMYDFSKDPDYEQIRPGVWRRKIKSGRFNA